jgi:drug/metabolite transporter (DMT)-like permease
MTTRAAPAPPQPQRSHALLRAVLWMCGALVSFSLIAIAGREASRVVSTTELMFWRGLIGITVLGSLFLASPRRRRDLMSGQPKLQIARSLVHFGAQFSWLYCLTLIPLAQLFALEFTAPLWVAVLAPLLLGERLTPLRIGAALLGFAGALVVVQPGQTALSYGAILALLSAVGFACNMIATKQLTKTDTAFTMLVWLNGLQALIGSGFMGQGFIWPDPMTWVWIIMVAVLGLTAHYSLTRAFGLADAIVVAPMDFLRLPLIAVVGAYAYGETLALPVALGGTLIVAANLLNILGERKTPQR